MDTLLTTAPANVVKRDPQRDRGGAWVVIGMEAFKVPALSLKDVQQVQEPVASLASMGTGGGAITSQQLAIVVDICHRALRRNYPDLTAEEVGDMLDLDNYQEVLGAVLRVSGFVRGKTGEQPGESAAPITGATSTPH